MVEMELDLESTVISSCFWTLLLSSSFGNFQFSR